MTLLEPKNPDYFDPLNCNPMDIPQRICELLKLDTYPIIIQFNSKEEVLFFAESVLKCNF